MNRARIARIALALGLVAAVSVYLEFGPRLLRAIAITAANVGEVFVPPISPRILPDVPFSDGGLEVVALSIDRAGPSVVRSFYGETGIKALRIYLDQNGDMSSAIGVNGIPATLLIDRAGRELGRRIGPAEWESPGVVAIIRKHLGDSSPS